MANGRVTFIDVLRVREFRALWAADAQSMAGDQLARVALSVLVFERTASSVLTALTYALTFLPGLLGGALLSGLADRYPHRRVLIACDVLRAAVLLTMVLPGIPIGWLAVLVVVSVLIGSPFAAAELALIPELLEGERYVVATGLRNITNQVAQLVGFALGGMVIAAIGPRAGLAVDAASFAVSAGVIWAGVRPRPSAKPRPDPGAVESTTGYLPAVFAGFALIARDRGLRTRLGLIWLMGLWVVPEGVAPPYALDIGGGTRAVGFLMAAAPAGMILGAYFFVRVLGDRLRSRLLGPAAVLTGAPLVLCALQPGLGLSILLWGLSGVLMAYSVPLQADFVRAVPRDQRGQVVGIGASGLLAVQGVGILLGGLIAQGWNAATAITVAGGLGAALAAWFAMGLAWASRPIEQAGPAPEGATETI